MIKISFKQISLLLTLFALVNCHAQTFQKETQENLKRNREAIESLAPNGVIADGYIKKQLDSNAASIKSTGSLSGANQSLSQTTKEDFLSLASKKAQQQLDPKRSDLLIFVSLSMPEEALKNYTAQAKRFNATLILRGFANDKLSTTRETLQRLNVGDAEWQISPEPFKSFKINKVPAIVLANAESGSLEDDGCARPSTYTSVFGDITVKDALDKISLHGQASIASIAKARLLADQQSDLHKLR